MASYSDLFDQMVSSALNSNPVVDKQASVSVASDEKKQSLDQLNPYAAVVASRTGRTDRLTNEVERDLATMDGLALYAKYGPQAGDLMAQYSQAQREYRDDITARRTGAQAVSDSAIDVGLGLYNALGGIAALGTSFVDDKAAATISNFNQQVNEIGQSVQSEGLHRRRRANNTIRQIDAEESDRIYEQELKTDGALLAGIRRFGRDVASTVSASMEDPMIFTSETAQATGSLVAAAPVAAAMRKAGEAAIRTGVRTAVLSPASTLVPKVMSVGSKATMPAAIGMMEGGGAFQQTMTEVMSMDHEDLLQTSPTYAQLIAENVSEEDAKIHVATRSAQMAAAIQAPIAAAIGAVPGMSKLEAAPFRAASSRTALREMGKESIEEAIQGSTGEISSTAGIRQYADNTRSYTEGVGEAFGQGALHGASAAGVVRGPGAVLTDTARAISATVQPTMRGVRYATDVAGQTAKVLGKPLYDRIIARADRIIAANEQASPVAPEKVAEAMATVSETLPDVEEYLQTVIDEVDATPEEKNQGTNYINTLKTAAVFDEAELNDPDIPENVRSLLAGSTNRHDAIERLTSFIEQAETGSMDQLHAAAALHYNLNTIEEALEQSDAGALDKVSDPQANQLLDQFTKILGSVKRSKTVKQALDQVEQVIQAAQEQGHLNPVEVGQLDTPEGRQAIRGQVAVAEISPLHSNPDANDRILFHADQGNIQLQPSERIALRTASALVRAQQARLEENQRLGLTPKSDPITEGIFINTQDERGKIISANDHLKRIFKAARSGDTDRATAYLEDFAKFGQHLQNKVAALNKSFKSGKGEQVKYQLLHPRTRQWVDSFQGLYVRPWSSGSVRQAQEIHTDAQALGQVVNELVAAFPNMGVKPIKVEALDPFLLSDTADVVAETYRSGGAKKSTEPAPELEDTGQPKGGDPDISAEATDTVEAEPVAEAAPEVVETEEESADVETVSSEPGSEPEPSQEQDRASEEGSDEAAETIDPSDEVAEPKGISAAYPNLLGSSLFTKVYKLPEEARTRTIGVESPVEAVREALTSEDAFVSFTGSELKHDLTEEISDAYQQLLSIGDALKSTLNDRLSKSKELSRFIKGDERLLHFENGKVLNLVEEQDGNYGYNDELVEAATLAGLQWVLMADRFQSQLDEVDVARITGIPVEFVKSDLIDQMNLGLGLVEAKRSLASKIKSYWGVTTDRNAPEGIAEGIPEALAAEMLHALEAAKLIQVDTLELTAADGVADGKPRTIYQILPRQLDEKNPLNAFPDAIERAVLVEPETVNYIGEVPSKVADTQLRNPEVQLTEQQKKAIRFEQQVPHYADLTMVNTYTSLGLPNVLKLFGAGLIEDVPMNQSHRKSLEGLNRTFSSAYLSMVQMMDEVRNKAGKAGVEPDQLPIHYDYTFTRVNRMQMLGLNNPQANKLMREAILPTRATIDLSNQNSEQFSAFALGLAQALGVKVHNMNRNAAVEKVLSKLDKDLAGSVQIIREWLPEPKNFTDEQVATFQQEMGEGIAPVAFHAVVEYARYLNTNNREEFTTSLYVEADGVTNGPINAMQLLTPGAYTLQWLRNVRKGGLFPGASELSMNQHREQGDPDDLYTETTNTLSHYMADFAQMMREVPGVSEQMLALNELMGEFIGDVTFDGEELIFERGIAKNPLTITIYGSGARGIANKITGELTNAIYERFSKALQAVHEDNSLSFAQAMFPESVDPEASWAAFQNNLGALTTSVVRKSKAGYYLTEGEETTSREIQPATFEFQKGELANLQQNMLTLFVEPLRAAVNNTVGNELMDAANLLRQGVQVQSIALQYAYQQKIAERLEQKAQEDPDWNSSDFLSRREQQEIFESLKDLAPFMETDAQRYFIAGSQNVDVGAKGFGSSLSVNEGEAKFRTPPYIRTPSDAGVAGIPAMVIGSGDGMMMQILSTMDGAPERTLKIFDGMHLPLDMLAEGSRKANQAVWESWQGNPLETVSKSFQAFQGAFSLDGASDAQIEALSRALNFRGKATKRQIEAAIKNLGDNLAKSARQVQARHNALAQVRVSVDQMAAVGAPYQHEGTISLEGLTDEEIVRELNRLAREDYLPKQEPKTETVSENIAPELEGVGRLLKNGAREVSFTALRKLARKLNIPSEQKEMLGDVLRTLTTKDYKVVYGNPDQLRAYTQERGLNFPEQWDQEGETFGATDPVNRMIYVANPTSETLLHELIHAATIDKVQAYYDGQDLGPNSVEQVRAIQRIEELMNQFLGLARSDGAQYSIKSDEPDWAAITARLRASRIDAEALKERFDSYGISDAVSLRVVGTLKHMAEGQKIGGLFAPLVAATEQGQHSVLMVARDAADGKQSEAEGTIDHEVIHALRSLGVITRDEWKVLREELQNHQGLVADVRRRYAFQNLSEGKLTEEAIADLFSGWRAGKIKLSPAPRSLFEKIAKFLTDLSYLVRGQTPPGSAQTIFEQIVSGEIGARDRSPNTQEFGEQFSIKGRNEFDNWDIDTQNAYIAAVEAIEAHLFAGNQAAALNEFMAWGLANSHLAGLQKKTKVSPLVQLARNVIDGLKRLIWGRRKMPAVADDMLSNLRFNTNILLQSKLEARSEFARTILFHNARYGNNDRLVELNETLHQKVIRHLRSTITRDNPRGDTELGKIDRALTQAENVARKAVELGFAMTEQERTTFETIVSTMATVVELDPNALARVQDLYAHVVKNIHVDDFLADEDANDPVKHYRAEQKVNFIVGALGSELDASGRSSLLPAFLGLAVVNDEFREVLSKLEVPKKDRKEGKSLDAMLTNLGNQAMERLGDLVSGQGSDAANVQAAIDALTQRIMETAQDRQHFMDQFSQPVGQGIDRVNDMATRLMQKGAEAVFEKASEIQSKTDNKAVQAAAALSKAMAAIVDENTSGRVAEGLMSAVNRSKMPKMFSDLINDLVGRTESNAQVYDMIKLVRDLVQQRRQQFRERLPQVIASKFSRKVTDEEWTAMFHGMGKTDLAALRQFFSEEEVLQLLQDPTQADAYIWELERNLKQAEPKNWQLIRDKARQYAHFMNTGEYGTHLLTNAYAIANLLGMGVANHGPVDDALVQVVDQLTTLYAYKSLPESTKDMLSSLASEEVGGMTFVMAYLVGQRVDELQKARVGNARANHYKGHVPTENQASVGLLVADDSEFAELRKRSFIRVGDYGGSNLERGAPSRGYYFAPVSGKAVYNQGIVQNVRTTAYGVDHATGFTHGLTAGRITDPALVQRIWQRAQNEKATEPLRPVFDRDGRVVAYERTVDPRQLDRLNQETNLANAIGIWRGRQLEEFEARSVNERLIDRLHDMWKADMKQGASKRAEYVDLLDPKELKKDPVLADAVSLLTPETHAYIEKVFGSHFYVRRDMLKDALGERAASVSDIWSGNSRWSPKALNQAQKLAIGIFGNNAYKLMVNSEKLIQNLVTDARVTIVVKSVIVPVVNLTSNIYQMWGRGVPMNHIARGMPKKAAEVNSYLERRLRLDEAEAELRAAESAGNQATINALKAEIQSIHDSNRRLSIWPLIEAGEFSSISDGNITREDLALTDGRLHEYVEKLVDKLPPRVRTFGRYAIIARDTALFQGLQRAVEYGDFLGKAILYDELTKRKGLSREQALARITEEFVNYDRQPGRFRGYLESIGLLWFWNFKIRSVKVALSMLRNNPVHSLLSIAVPHPTMFGTVGGPIQDNLFSVAADGKLDYSIGPGMGIRSWQLNPWFNMTT